VEHLNIKTVQTFGLILLIHFGMER